MKVSYVDIKTGRIYEGPPGVFQKEVKRDPSPWPVRGGVAPKPAPESPAAGEEAPPENAKD
jgi:hypothetical protein